MPVQKFRSIEDMEHGTWRQPGDPALYRVIAAVWAFGRRSRPRRFPPGVYRHRSMAALNGQTEQWQMDELRRVPAARVNVSEREHEIILTDRRDPPG